MKQREIIFDVKKFVQLNQGFIMPPRSKILIKSLNTVKECINSAIFMASQIELVEHGLSTARPEIIRPAYFRASLSELCRIEDILKSHSHFNFYNSDDPTLHIVKLLRNYQVHISNMELISGYIKVKLSGEEMIYRNFIAENISVLELRKLDSSKFYSDEQLDQLVQLFNLEQRKLGVVQLLYHIIIRIEEYTKNILIK